MTTPADRELSLDEARDQVWYTLALWRYDPNGHEMGLFRAIDALIAAAMEEGANRAPVLPDNPALKALAHAKILHPELRLCQIIENALAPGTDLYYTDDQELADLVMSCLRAQKEPQG